MTYLLKKHTINNKTTITRTSKPQTCIWKVKRIGWVWVRSDERFRSSIQLWVESLHLDLGLARVIVQCRSSKLWISMMNFSQLAAKAIRQLHLLPARLSYLKRLPPIAETLKLQIRHDMVVINSKFTTIKLVPTTLVQSLEAVLIPTNGAYNQLLRQEIWTHQ